MKLSVALCSYNGERFIVEQLNSILNQTLLVNEIIICDDKSTDSTLEILIKFQEKYPDIIRIVQNQTNLEIVKNFEKAISLCTGDIIFLSDQDDIWAPNKVEHYFNFFANHPTIEVLASNGYCIDDNSIVHEKYSIWDIPEFFKEMNIKINYFKTIITVANIATGASMAFRKSIIPEISPFPSVKGFYHDGWIALIAASQNSFELINEKFFYYRIHEKQQVGGIFFEKTIEQKKEIIKLFNIAEKNSNFAFLKSKLAKLASSYKRNNKLIDYSGKHLELIKKISNEIEVEYIETVAVLSKKHPTSYFILKISDKILNKKQRNLK